MQTGISNFRKIPRAPEHVDLPSLYYFLERIVNPRRDSGKVTDSTKIVFSRTEISNALYAQHIPEGSVDEAISHALSADLLQISKEGFHMTPVALAKYNTLFHLT